MNYMHNVLITGGKGQLGLELNEIANKYLDYNCFFTDVSDLDISDHILVNKFIEKNEIKTIINCAAYTAVDMAEKNFDMDDKLPCFKENVETKCLKGTKGRSVGKNFDW